MMRPMANVLFVGAGAVGAPIAAWLVGAGHDVTVLARGATADALEGRGITWFLTDAPTKRATERVKVVRTLGGLAKPDLVVFAVKTSAMPAVMAQVSDAFGTDVRVVGLQNGIEALRTLPSVFSRSALALVHFNGFVDADGSFGLPQRGALVVAPLGHASEEDADVAARILRDATRVVRTERARDAVLCKMVVNLSGSLQTLTALHERPADDEPALQNVFSGLLVEGVAVVRAAGAREVRVPGTPPWVVMQASRVLPPVLTRPIFRRNVRKMRVSSLAQDVARGLSESETELDVIHGELVRLADAFHVKAPIMRTVLRELRARLAKKPFEPMRVSELNRLTRTAPSSPG